MSSRIASSNTTDDDPSSGRLLRDIEEISRALYLHKTPPKGLISPLDDGSKPAGTAVVKGSKTKVVNEELLRKDKKSSIWWKPMKALTHMGRHRFNCCFFLHMHAIEGLSSEFYDLSLRVGWKRKDEVLRTRPARVSRGVAEFEETLMHQCCVYGSRSGPQHSAKYEPKLIMLFASVIEAPTLDIGKHWIDLTRFLPLTLEELEDGKRSSGKWTTSFKLTGKAKGATISVSLGFSVMGNNSLEPIHFANASEIQSDPVNHVAVFGQTRGTGNLRRLGSVPGNSTPGLHFQSRSFDLKNFQHVLPNQGLELAQSITFLYQKLDEVKSGSSEAFDFLCGHLGSNKSKLSISPQATGENSDNENENENENIEFTVSDQGIEMSVDDQARPEQDSYQTLGDSIIETIDVADIFEEAEATSDEETICMSNREIDSVNENASVMNGGKNEDSDAGYKEPTIEELELMFSDLLNYGPAEVISPQVFNESAEQDDYETLKSQYKAAKKARSLSLDDVTESVANDFLDMLGIEQSTTDVISDSWPDSPRERLLRQFEEESVTSESIFNLDASDAQVDFSSVASTVFGRMACSDDFDLPFGFQIREKEKKSTTQTLRSKRNVKVLENLETKDLMRRWGLEEEAFRNSPHISSSGFGSPIYIPAEEPLQLPPLGEGLGSSVRIRNGGLLRSMSPLLFRFAKNNARLIMQVSNSVVLPAAMGSSIMDKLELWASVGVEKMCNQASQLMPLEDITGNMIQQLFWETESGSAVHKSDRFTLSQEFDGGHGLFYVEKSFQDGVFHQGPISIKQSMPAHDMDSDSLSLEDVAALSMSKIETLSVEGLRIQCNMSQNEAPSSIRPQSSNGVGSSRDDVADVDELINLSISLDEWIRLDAGDLSNENRVDERYLTVLASRDDKYTELNSSNVQKNDEEFRFLGRNFGLFGNTLTIALRLQLRDPFRDFEMVGTPMLILVQVERTYLQINQEVRNGISGVDSRDGDPNEHFNEGGIYSKENAEGIHKQWIPRFRISEVHVAGFSGETGDKPIWGTQRQQQSASRWLLSSGLGRTRRNPVSKSHAITKVSSNLTRSLCRGDILWSISHDTRSTATNWKDSTALSTVRNPDIKFPGC